MCYKCTAKFEDGTEHAQYITNVEDEIAASMKFRSSLVVTPVQVTVEPAITVTDPLNITAVI